MIKVRNGVFETNSSSVHSMIMCSKEEYDQLKGNKMLIDRYYESLISFEEARQKYSTEFPDAINIYEVSDLRALQLLSEYDIAVTLEEYNDRYNGLDGFYKEYITPSGETVIAFGEYGYDG